MQVLLLDVDGVLVRRMGYFSERFSREHSIPLENIMTFFNNEFKQCLIGKADLKVELSKYLIKWGWQGSIDDFLKYWFESETDLQLDILEYVSQLRKLGIQVFLVTSNEKYRTEFLMKHFNFIKMVDGVFSSCDLGADKNEAQFFKGVLKAMPTVLPEDIVLCDDDEKNIKAAEKVGIKGILFVDLDDLKHQIQDLD